MATAKHFPPQVRDAANAAANAIMAQLSGQGGFGSTN